MKRKFLALFLAACMLLALCACNSTPSSTSASSGGSTAQADGSTGGDGTYDKLVVSFRTNATVPSEKDTAEVQEAINQITREAIGAEVELIIIQSGSYPQQMQLMLSGSEQLDVMGAHATFLPSALSSGQLMDIGALMDEYGQGIKEVLPEDLLRSGDFGGTMYCVPILADMGTGNGYYVMRKDIVDKYNIDISTIKTYEDLSKVFATVKENEPDLTVVAPRNAGNSFLEYSCTWDRLGDYMGVLDNYADNLDVVNLFETESYREYLDVVRDWYQKGYISADVANAVDSGQEQMKAGTLFSYCAANKPGEDSQEQMATGREVVGVQLLDTLTVTFTIWQWAIPQNSAHPEKAMQFLNMMYTDPDIINLLAFGIEGEDYAVRDDGRIGYPDGVDASNVGYSLSGILWQFGNEFNAHVWETNDADIWEQTKKWNEVGNPERDYHVSKAYGFRFDSEPVQNEMAAVTNVYKEYNMSLECGLLDPDETLGEMNERLYSAGLQKIIDEKQKQLDAWAEANGVS